MPGDPHQIHNQFINNRRVRGQMLEQTRAWMQRFDDTFVTAQELRASGIEWRYPENGAPLNRVSPLEWTQKAKPAPVKLHEE